MTPKVLVTGGAGVIGSHVADALLAAGGDSIVLDNLSPPKRAHGRALLRCRVAGGGGSVLGSPYLWGGGGPGGCQARSLPSSGGQGVGGPPGLPVRETPPEPPRLSFWHRQARGGFRDRESRRLAV